MAVAARAHAVMRVACAAHVDMCAAWMHVMSMGKMVQIRNMPDDVHRTLKVRAAQRGISLSDYLLRLAERDAAHPSIEELSARIAARGALRLPPGAVARAIAEGREERS